MPFLDNWGYSEWAAKFQEKIKFEDKLGHLAIIKLNFYIRSVEDGQFLDIWRYS